MTNDVRDDALWQFYERAIACDTAVRPGDHRISADDPRLAKFIAGVATPILEDLGATTWRDSAGNLIAAFGQLTGREVLFVAYPATHHGNRTADPLVARRAVIDGVEQWTGQGTNEGKGPFVAFIDALQRTVEREVQLADRVVVAVSTEGSSSNHSSTVMFDELPVTPAGAVLLVGTENRLALGHRGRADVLITTSGPDTHSSIAATASNPISDLCAAERAIRPVADRWAADRHGRSVTPYRMVCGPIAPHTMPTHCELALDCRYLVGDDITALRRLLEATVLESRAEVGFGPVMLPAATETSAPVVVQFREAARRAGHGLATYVPEWTFDAGAAHVRDVPAVLFGPSTDRLTTITDSDTIDRQTMRIASNLLTELLALIG